MKYSWIGVCLLSASSMLQGEVPLKKAQSTKPQQVTESVSVEWNWSTLRIRFVGRAWPETPEEGFASVQKRAFADGLASAVQEVSRHHQAYLKNQRVSTSIAAESAAQAGARMSRIAYAYDTKFFGDGSVQLSMESQLPAALLSSAVSFPIEKASRIQGITETGVVLRSGVYVPPMPIYEVVDEGGQLLFGIQHVAKDMYLKNLMGRWLTRTSTGKIEGLQRAVGNHPIFIEIIRVEENRLQVDGAKWKEALGTKGALLENAKIAVVTPSAP